jgi:hypothetical protein
MDEDNEDVASRKRLESFPPHLASSYVTREQSELLHGLAMAINPARFVDWTGVSRTLYANVPYRLPSPHALWGTLPLFKHPFLRKLATGEWASSLRNNLTESVYVVDKDFRKQQEADRITISMCFRTSY